MERKILSQQKNMVCWERTAMGRQGPLAHQRPIGYGLGHHHLQRASVAELDDVQSLLLAQDTLASGIIACHLVGVIAGLRGLESRDGIVEPLLLLGRLLLFLPLSHVFARFMEFFSFGGTALIMLLAEMGVLLSVSRHSNTEKM